MADLTAARKGKLGKALDKQFNFIDSGGVMSRQQQIWRYHWHRKSTSVQHYASKKRKLEYAKLVHPKVWHTLWRWENGREVGLAVPKIVWEHFTDIPEAEYQPYVVPPTSPPYDPLKMDTVCPACGGPTDWYQDNFPTGPHRLICLDNMDHTSADLDLFNNLGPEPSSC